MPTPKPEFDPYFGVDRDAFLVRLRNLGRAIFPNCFDTNIGRILFNRAQPLVVGRLFLAQPNPIH